MCKNFINFDFKTINYRSNEESGIETKCLRDNLSKFNLLKPIEFYKNIELNGSVFKLGTLKKNLKKL